MKYLQKILLAFILIFFLIPLKVSANLTFELENQVGVVGNEISIYLLPKTGTPDFAYAMHSSNISRDEWNIKNDTFYWIPKNSGLYTATFSVIDGKGNFSDETILFSIISKKLNEYREQSGVQKREISTKLIETKKTKYLYTSQIKNLTLYQPISLYYTKGKTPVSITLERYNQSIALKCNKGSSFNRDDNFIYGGEIFPPSWISALRVENEYNVNIPENAVSFIKVDLPENVSVSGCSLIISNQNANEYNTFSLENNELSETKIFKNGTGIAVNNGMLIILSNNKYLKTQQETESKLKSPYDKYSTKNVYLKSLYSADFPEKIKKKNPKHALSRAEMVSLIIHTTSFLSDRVDIEKARNREYWGYSDVRKSEEYRGEIYLFEKYGFNKGISGDDFRPSQMATMEDFYFAISEVLDIYVNWWERDTLKRELFKKGILKSSDDFGEILTLERIARPLFLILESSRKVAEKLDTNDKNILIAKREDVIDDDIIYRSWKTGGVSRGDFLEILIKNEGKDYKAFQWYEDEFVKKDKKRVIYEDIKIDNSIAPYIAFAFEQGYLPEEWKGLEELTPSKNISKYEALEIILRSKGEYSEAKRYFDKKIKPCFEKNKECDFGFIDFNEDKNKAREFVLAHYAKKEGIISSYTDRFENEMSFFFGEKKIDLIEVLKLF